jgi:CubicO group peptidase (beta-lactamase class C family)
MTKPESLGFSSTRLATLDRVMKERYIDGGMIPGLHTQVFRRGELVHSAIAGSMDIGRGKAWREDAIVRIYSMTKPIACVALMMLVEEGKLGLEDNVDAHIPSWAGMGVYSSGVPSFIADTTGKFMTKPPARAMKVIDLFTHTSGLTAGFMMRTPVDAEYRRVRLGDRNTPGGLDTFVEQLSKIPLDFSPGTAWNYSVSIDVIGYLVQKLSGQTFGEFLRTRLFEPLGMNDTSFSVPAGKTERFATCYMPGKGGGLAVQDDAGKSPFLEPPKLESGGGGLVSTGADYLRFCRMMLGKGALDGARVLSPKTVALFSMNFLPDGKYMSQMLASDNLFSEVGYSGIGYSLGCSVMLDPAVARMAGTPGEFAWGGAAATAFWIDPKEELAVVFLTQVLGSDARLTLRRDLRTLVYSAMTESYT